MNILYIADSSSWHNAKWTEYFAERHNVFLFSDFKENYKPVKFHENITLIEIPPIIKTNNRHLNKISSIYHYKRELDKIVNDLNIDIVHSVAIYYAFLASISNLKVPFIYTQQGSELLVRAEKSFIYRFMAKYVFRKVDIVTGDSKVIQSAGIKYGAPISNNYIIQNGVDLRHFKCNRKANLLDDNRVLHLFSPRAITPLYNIDLIIKALSILKHEHNLKFICKFTFGFGDEYLTGYKQMVEENGLADCIQWIGYVDHADMPDCYRNSDISISVPSSDSSPKSVYESMACGVPAIVSNLPWVKEILSPNINVIVCNDQTSESLAFNILKLSKERDLYESIKAEGLQLVKESFSYMNEMRKMETIMLNAISNNGVTDAS